MYRTSVYRRQARAKAIRRKKFYAHATGWIYTHPDGALSKGKIHCSCPMCAAICFCLDCVDTDKEIDIEIPEPLEKALKEIKDPIRLCTYLLKQPLFEQGAVTVALIVANKELIHTKRGILLIPDEKFTEFKQELDAYKESEDDSKLYAFLSSCIEPLPEVS